MKIVIMIKNSLFAVLVFNFMFLCVGATAQEKRPISHDDYDQWKQIENYGISNDGRRVAYEINPQEGDGWLFFKSPNGFLYDSVARGSKAEFSSGGNFAVFSIKTPFDTLRQAKLKKVKKENLPKDSLGIVVFDNGDVFKFANLKSYQIPSVASDWVALLTDPLKTKSLQDSVSKDSVAAIKKVGSKSKKSDKPGTLTILNPVFGDSAVFHGVTHFQINDNGKICVFAQQLDDNIDSVQVSVFFTDERRSKVVF